MNKPKTINESGFTIIELLIVFVLILFLSGLVFFTFKDIKSQQRDTERETDIKAIYSSVESYYAQYNKYPSLAEINDKVFREQYLKTLEVNQLRDPSSDKTELVNKPAKNIYAYELVPENCDNKSNECKSYKLTTTKETGETYIKNSLNL